MKITVLILILSLVSCGKKVSSSKPNSPSNITPTKTHTQVNQTLPTGSNVTDKFVITPDQSKIIYISDERVAGKNELFVANVDGTGTQAISQPLDLGENVYSFLVSPNSQKVAFIADPTAGQKNLYTVNLDGSDLYQVNAGVMDSSHSVPKFLWLPNSTKLVYATDEGRATNTHYLYIANTDGSSRTTLSTGPIDYLIFDISANGSKIVYMQNFGNPVLKSVNPDGSSNFIISRAFSLPSSRIWNFVISPDSLKVAYLSNLEDELKDELFLVNIGGGSSSKISGSLITSGNVLFTDEYPKEAYDFTNDSSQIIFIADKTVNERYELFIAPLSGASQMNLSGNSIVSGGDVKSFKKMGNKTLFLGDIEIDNATELFVANNDGSGYNKINSDLVANEKVGYFTTDGTHIAYLMDKGNLGYMTPYLNSVTGIDELQLVTDGTGTGYFDTGAIHAEQLKINNQRVFFRGSSINNINNLYYFNINSSEIVQVSEDNGYNVLLSGSELGSSFVVTQDGTRTIYRKNINSRANLISSEN